MESSICFGLVHFRNRKWWPKNQGSPLKIKINPVEAPFFQTYPCSTKKYHPKVLFYSPFKYFADEDITCLSMLSLIYRYLVSLRHFFSRKIWTLSKDTNAVNYIPEGQKLNKCRRGWGAGWMYRFCRELLVQSPGEYWTYKKNTKGFHMYNLIKI